MALKIQWVKTYHENSEIRILAKTRIKHGIAATIWESNLNEIDAILSVKQGFWQDVVRAWCKYSYVKPIS